MKIHNEHQPQMKDAEGSTGSTTAEIVRQLSNYKTFQSDGMSFH